MRDIKFRGVDIKTGKMVFGGGIDSQRDTPIIINHGKRYFVDAKTVGQYTGLKDKNGVEIYEGDILRCQHEHLWFVGFCERGCFVAHDPEDALDYVLLDDWSFSVIDNIYQNPELLGN